MAQPGVEPGLSLTGWVFWQLHYWTNRGTPECVPAFPLLGPYHPRGGNCTPWDSSRDAWIQVLRYLGRAWRRTQVYKKAGWVEGHDAVGPSHSVMGYSALSSVWGGPLLPVSHRYAAKEFNSKVTEPASGWTCVSHKPGEHADQYTTEPTGVPLRYYNTQLIL